MNDSEPSLGIRYGTALKQEGIEVPITGTKTKKDTAATATIPTSAFVLRLMPREIRHAGYTPTLESGLANLAGAN